MSKKHTPSIIDQLCMHANDALDALHHEPDAHLKTPGHTTKPNPLTPAEKKHVGGLMRINHVGELCAQALYMGQALTTSNHQLKATLKKMAEEEQEHLSWCKKRLNDLQEKPSVLNPLWYLGSFGMGMVSGLCPKEYGLGFIEETEQQVCEHLTDQRKKIPKKDTVSQAIVKRMQQDEQGHATWAKKHGATTLPASIKCLMRACATIMKKCAYVV
jgi:3-demethoxyubiquinol 3-hydroxylase